MVRRDLASPQETTGGPELWGKGQWTGTRLRDHDVLKGRYNVVCRPYVFLLLCF